MAIYLRGTKHGIDWLIWEMDESLEALKEFYPNYAKEIPEQYRNPKRQIEFLCSRIALQHLFKQEVQVEYNTLRKPHLKNSNEHISISHSGNLVVVAKSNFPIGIDIEKTSNKLDKVKHKFCSEEELARLKSKDSLKQLCLIWSAKESMYKLIGNYPFQFDTELITIFKKIEQTGTVKGTASVNNISNPINIDYQLIEDYVFTMAQNKQ